MKILITGNGFDIAHGLPTTYNEFINTIKLIKQSNVDNLPTDYLSYFQENDFFNNNSLIEKHFKFDKEKIIELKEKSNNLWLDFFIKQFNIYTWIDFEKQIESIVQILDKIIIKLNTEVFNINDISIKSSNLISLLSQKSQVIDTVFDFKLLEKHKFTNENFVFNLRYCQTASNQILHLKEDSFFKDLKIELDNFAELFDMYLNIFVEPLSNILQESHTKELKGITNHFTFNYTNTFKKLYKCNIDSFFLHGRISTTASTNNIIFGFNDVFESIVETKNYIPFTKYYQKLSKETDYKYFDTIEIDGFTRVTIYFWGHSLNKSDKIYIDEAFELIEKKTESSIKIFFHNKKSKDDIILNLMSMYDSAKIVDMCRKGKLIFLETNTQNIKKELDTFEERSRFMMEPSIHTY